MLERQEALGSLQEWFFDVVKPEVKYVFICTVSLLENWLVVYSLATGADRMSLRAMTSS